MATRRVLLQLFSATASSVLILPAEAKQSTAPSPDQLPPVTVTSPKGVPKPARNRGTRNTAVVEQPQSASQCSKCASSEGSGDLQPSAASAIRFTGPEVNAVPFTRPGEALEIVPGLIVTVGLFKTEQRNWLSTVRDDHVEERTVGIWTDTTTRWTDWLRTTFGICEDLVSGRVLSNTLENSGNAQASMASPKGAVVLGPWIKTEFYSNAGYGLHSNDIQGATITVDPTYKLTPLDRGPLLVRSRGAEVGLCTKAIESLTSSFAIFVLDFDSELLFVGDAGTTEATEPPHRRRMVQPVQAGALVFARSRCRLHESAFHQFRYRGRPGAPAWVGSASIVLGNETGWFGTLKARATSALGLSSRMTAFARSPRSFSTHALAIGSTTACGCNSICSISSTRKPIRSNILTCHACRASRSTVSPSATCTPPSRLRCG